MELDPFEIVSTGTRAETLAKDSPVRTELIEASLWKSTGARDLASAIEYLPGLRTEANCQNCGTAEIRMLGLGSGYHQLLFDGQPLFSGLAAVYGIEQIPSSSIGRVEVVKGGASTLYGTGAVAGVINVIPHEPVSKKTELDFSLTSVTGTPFYSTSFLKDDSKESGDFAYSLYGQFNDNDAVDLNEDGFSEITRKRFKTIGLNAWIYPAEQGKLSFNLSFSDEYRRGGNALDRLPHESQITEELEHEWLRGGVFWESVLGKELNYRVSTSLSQISRNSYYGGVGAVPLPGSPGYNEDVYHVALEASRLLYGYTETERHFSEALFFANLDKHSLTWGAQFQSDSVFDEKRDDGNRSLCSDGTLASFVGEDPIVDSDTQNWGVFIQDEWTPTLSTSLISGIRWDRHSSLSEGIVSPQIALRQTISPEWTWRLSATTGFRAPEVFDEDFHIEILDDPVRTLNDPDLKEERSASYTTGFIWTPASDGDRRYQFTGELYRTVISDTFHVSDEVFESAEGYEYKLRRNSGGSVVQGGELGARITLAPAVTLNAGFAYNDARFDVAQEVLPGLSERRFLETPEWTGTAQLTIENEQFADLFIGLIYTGPMIALKEVEESLNRATPEFFVVDLTLSKHLDWQVANKTLHLDLMAGVRNLFDERQQDLTTGPDRDTTYFYGPRFPRSYVMQVSTKW